jgi:hypothetical protein
MLSKALLYCWLSALLITPSIAADISIGWDASTSPNIAGHKVYYGTAPGVYGAPITIGNQTSYTVTGLAPGTWYLTVTAFDTAGNESDFATSKDDPSRRYVSTTISSSKVCDANADGKTNILDMQVLAAEITQGKTDLSRDYNGDGLVNALDLRVLANVILGLKTCP